MTGAMGSRLSPAAEVRSTVGAMQVTPANVLHIRNALLAESRLLTEKVAAARLQTEVRKPGQDPVSQTAAQGFNEKINSLMTQCHAYVSALTEAAGNLEQMAKSYGHTEQQISDSFERFQTDNPAPTALPSSAAAPGPAVLSFAQSLANQGPRPPSASGELRSLFPGTDGAHP
jgi:uncharacterized protein YukE